MEYKKVNGEWKISKNFYAKDIYIKDWKKYEVTSPATGDDTAQRVFFATLSGAFALALPPALMRTNIRRKSNI